VEGDLGREVWEVVLTITFIERRTTAPLSILMCWSWGKVVIQISSFAQTDSTNDQRSSTTPPKHPTCGRTAQRVRLIAISPTLRVLLYPK
jgi:hypothetical protein